MLTTVVFDADETLLDLRPAMTGGLLAVLDEMRRLTPAAVAVSLADLETDWSVAFTANPTRSMPELRRLALARSVSRVGLDVHLDDLLALYFARRFALTRPFPDVLPALAALTENWAVGFATNGNSRAERCGLAGRFAFEVYAHENGLPKKPAPEFYAAVVQAAGVPAGQVVYVGDSIAHDVVGAQTAGLRAVWLNRDGRPCPPGVRPDAELSTLTDLPGVLAALVDEEDLRGAIGKPTGGNAAGAVR